MTIAVLALLFTLAFTAALATVFVASLMIQRRRTVAAGEPGSAGGAAAWADDLPGLLKSEELSSISFWDGLLKRLDFATLLADRITQAELNWSPGRVTLSMLLCGTVALAIVWKVPFIPFWLGVLVLPLASMFPYWYILHRRKRRFRRFQALFPDALDSLARALRAGAAVSAALEMVATESEGPVAVEIRKTFVEVNFGMAWDRALENLARRVPLAEVALFVAALQIHSRTGGRLGDIMNRLAEGMREQNSLEGEIRSIAAHGKLTGFILTLVPVGIVIMMLIVSPEYIRVLLDHPYGKHMIAAAIVCLCLAHFIIQKLVDIEI
jgi:tight adherence protein B